MAKAGGNDSTSESAAATSAGAVAGAAAATDSPAPAPAQSAGKGTPDGNAKAAKLGAKIGFLAMLGTMLQLDRRRSNESMMASIGARLAQFGLTMPKLGRNLRPHEAENIMRAFHALAAGLEAAASKAKLAARLKMKPTPKAEAAPKVAPRQQRRPTPLPMPTPKPPTLD
jgi:hypothetical protein